MKLIDGGSADAAGLRDPVKRADAPEAARVQLGWQDIRWELEAAGGSGTRLTLWHNIDRRFISMGAAGWHICFDVLDGSSRVSRSDASSAPTP